MSPGGLRAENAQEAKAHNGSGQPCGAGDSASDQVYQKQVSLDHVDRVLCHLVIGNRNFNPGFKKRGYQIAKLTRRTEEVSSICLWFCFIFFACLIRRDERNFLILVEPGNLLQAVMQLSFYT